ncbi:type III pantothenate kinase [Luteimonas sp. A478]
MSRWLFDLGNTRLKLAPMDAQGRIGEVRAIGHDGSAFAPDWQSLLPERIESAAVASVAAAPLRAILLDALSARSGRISVASTLARCDGVRVAYPRPERLGVDRFLTLLGAHARGPGPWLLVGVGTALTIDLLDDRGRHHGGRIAPSPALMRQALHARAAQLPDEGGAYVEFAVDTDDALASGCEGAALALIERSRTVATRELGQAPVLLMHGGGAGPLAAGIEGALLAPQLVLEGLARWLGMEESS